MLPSFEAMFVSLTKGATAALEHSVMTLGSGSKVKFKKDNLIRPLGTVIIQIHCCDGRKLPGKLGLETNPLDAPLIVSPAPLQATGNKVKDKVIRSQTVVIQCLLYYAMVAYNLKCNYERFIFFSLMESTWCSDRVLQYLSVFDIFLFPVLAV